MSGAAQNEGAKPQVPSDDVQSSTKSAQIGNSTDNGTAAAAAAAEEGSSENQQEAAGSSERPAASPEPNCAICLGQLENKSFTDSCFHMFCFVCLQEWSKVKAECPLCKQPFKSIIHNVKSYNNYDQFYLDHHHHQPQPEQPRVGSFFGWNFDRNFDRSFRFRTTLTMDHRYFSLRNQMTDQAPPSPSYQRHRPRLRPRPQAQYSVLNTFDGPMTATNFRRHVYNTGRRVTDLRATNRRRRASPDFFRTNPAQIHRLVPWLRRELNVLLYNMEDTVNFVQGLILDLIKRFPIDSDEFFELVHPYLRGCTRQFMHEFLFFARSPYTMQTYDQKAIYDDPRYENVSSVDSESNDSDVVVVDDDEDDVWERGGAEGSSAWHSPQALAGASQSSVLAQSRWDSPTPGPSWDLSGNSSHSPVNVDDSSDSDASTIIDPTYVASEEPASQAPPPPSPDSSDEEAVIFLSYDKPWEERSPIQLSSGSESERETSYSLMIKALKQEHSKRKKARSSSGTSHQNRDGAHDRSRSPSPPVLIGHQLRSHNSTSTTHDLPESASRASSKSKDQGRHHKKRHHHDKLEDAPHHSSRKEKRKSSHSHSSMLIKKHRHEETTTKDGDMAQSSTSHNKQKHKKRKNTAKRDKHSKKHSESPRAGGSEEESEEGALSMLADRADHCKKHPSGHKKTRVRTREGVEGQEGGSGHQSDSLLSDTSSSSGSSTATTTSLTDSEPRSAPYISRQQRVQQVLQERQRQTSLPPMAPSWENISWLARMLASQPPTSFLPVPGPSQSSSDPVVISTTDDDSDCEPQTSVAYRIASDAVPVAKTVVVPCSSNPEVPTAAIDFASTLASTSAHRPIVLDGGLIDVETISSEDETSERDVVDVESLEDTDSNSETISLGNGDTQDRETAAAGVSAVTERSAEVERVLSPQTTGMKHGSKPASSGKAQKSKSTPGVSAKAKSKTKTALSIHSMTAFKSYSRKKKYIVKEDVFMGNEAKPMTRQISAAQSSQKRSCSQPQSLGASSGAGCLNQERVGYFSVLDQLCSQLQEKAAQASLSATVTGHPTANQSLSALSQPSAENNPSPPPVFQHSTDSHSIPLTVFHFQSSADSCSLPPVSHAGEGHSQSSAGSPQSSEGQDSGEQAKEEGLGSGVQKRCVRKCNTSVADVKKTTSDFKDKQFDLTADNQLCVQESAYGKERKEDEAGQLNDSIHDVDFSFDKLLENEDDRGSITEKQKNAQESIEHKKCEDGEAYGLSDPYTTNMDEDAEKLLLSEDISTCVPSDQGNQVKDLTNSVSSGMSEPTDVSKLQIDCETGHKHTVTTSAGNNLVQDLHHSSLARDETASKAETNTSS